MLYFRFAAFVIIDIIANLVGYLLVNWWVPLLADKEGNLPRALCYFQTHDANLDGVSPEGGFEPRFVTATSWLRDSSGQPKNLVCRHLIRSLWLYRNNVYGFSHYVLGAPGKFKVSLETTTPPPNDRYPATNGRSLVTAVGADGRKYFQFKLVKQWGASKCHEIHAGWKINDGMKDRAMLVFRYSPFRTFESEFR